MRFKYLVTQACSFNLRSITDLQFPNHVVTLNCLKFKSSVVFFITHQSYLLTRTATSIRQWHADIALKYAGFHSSKTPVYRCSLRRLQEPLWIHNSIPITTSHCPIAKTCRARLCSNPSSPTLRVNSIYFFEIW